MRFKLLQQLFLEQNPTGQLEHDRKLGRYNIRYHKQGKWYGYRASSNYAMAERLDLIPAISTVEIAQRVMRALLSGETSVIDYAGAGDTIRHLWTGKGIVDEGFSDKLDKYGRPYSCYRIGDPAEDALWSSTVRNLEIEV